MSKLFGNLAITIPFYELATPDRSNSLSKVANLTAVRNPLASVFKPAKPNKQIEREKPEKEKKLTVNIVKDKDLDDDDLEADFIDDDELLEEPDEDMFDDADEDSPKKEEVVTRSRRSRKRKVDPDAEEDSASESNHLPREQHQFCKNVIEKLMKHEYAYVFNQPVDPVALNIPDYFDVIKNPMDFHTIKELLKKANYKSMNEFYDDVKLVFNNARTYNAQDSDVYLMANTLDDLFEKIWKKGAKLNAPPAAPIVTGETKIKVKLRKPSEEAAPAPPPVPKPKPNPFGVMNDFIQQELENLKKIQPPTST